MDKSQLRRLTHAYSHGDIDQAEYRRDRARLIDDICARAVSIERVAAPTPQAQPTAEDTPAASNRPGSGARPIFVFVGACVFFLLVWSVYPTHKTPNAVRTQIASETQPPKPVHMAGPGEHLISEFLGVGDWSPASVDRFVTAWGALTEFERKETHTSGSFTKLRDTVLAEARVYEQIHTLSGSLDAREFLAGLSGLASVLEIDPIAVPPSPVAPSTVDPEAISPGGIQTAILDSTEASDAGDEIPTETSADDISVDAEIPGVLETAEDREVAQPLPAAQKTTERWLDTYNGSGYAIQLFAFGSSESAQNVVDLYPELKLKTLVFPGSPVAHRVMMGAYENQEAATQAYRSLPSSIASRETPIVMAVEEIRADLALSTIDSMVATSLEWLTAQPETSYTLQLFALSSDGHVTSLLQTHPEVDLEVHYSESPGSRFRILHGVFDTPQSAAAAFEKLPLWIRRQTPKPVVRRFGDLQDTSSPLN